MRNIQALKKKYIKLHIFSTYQAVNFMLNINYFVPLPKLVATASFNQAVNSKLNINYFNDLYETHPAAS